MASHAQRTIEAIDRLVARERALSSPRGPGSDVMKPEPSKSAALRDAARVLDSIGVRYAVIGGIAVGIHSGVPRATLDVDVAVQSSVARDRVRSALEAAGFTFTGAFPHTSNFRHPSGEPVQAVFDAVFDAAIDRATRIDLDGVPIRVVTKADLIALKDAAGADPARRRSKALRDQADAALLRGDAEGPDEGW